MRLTLTELRERLPIDKHDLDNELMRQSAVQEEVARNLAAAVRLLAKAKDDMEEAEFEQMTRAARDSADKLTVEAKKGRARMSAQWKNCRTAYQAAQQEVDEWQAALDAWVSRGYDLRKLADVVQLVQYQGDSTRTHRDRDLRRMMREAAAPASMLKRRSSG